MELERRRSKGSFFSLFDWNGKSRKKLFSDTPNFPEISKQGKENEENMQKSQLNRIKVDDNGAGPSNTASCDFNCALSVTSDEGCGTKAPGLVARLMGLDSLPVSTVTELSSTSLYGSNSLGSYHGYEGAVHSMADCSSVDYMHTPLKLQNSSWNTKECRAQKVENLPIKRFQTEMLPPKSAKPIPVTHNKLLSPIRSPGFIPQKNAAHLMEAAAKIIEASPRPYTRSRMSPVGPSSVPLRILDLKEKLEAAQYVPMTEKLMNPSNNNTVDGKQSLRSSSLYKCNPALKGSRDSEKNSSHHFASRRKSVSLAVQAKANVQSQDTLNSNGSRGYVKQNKYNGIKSSQISKSQKPSLQRTMQQKACTSWNSNVLGQNNQKQNSAANKGKATSKIDSNKPTTRSSSSVVMRKATNKSTVNANIEPQRSSTIETGTQKQFPLSRGESISLKKRYIRRDVHDARRPDNVLNKCESKSIRCNITTDGSIDQDTFNMKESKDVISFTFTSPLRRSMPESLSSTKQVMGTINRIDVNSLDHNDKLYPKKLTLSPPAIHMIDGDALSVLLEKKLQELTSRINLPEDMLAAEGSSAGLRSSLPEKVPSLVNTTSREQDTSFQSDLLINKVDSMHDYCCSSSNDPVLNMNQQPLTSDAIDDPRCSSNSGSEVDLGCQKSRSVTSFENPFVSESCLDSKDSTYGSTVYSSVQDEEVSNFSQINESVSLENEVNWSEQSCSTLPGRNVTDKQLSGISNLVDFDNLRNMEVEYVKDILSHAELMTEEFVMGQTDKVIMPNLFDLLENQSSGTESYREENSKLERKVLFDRVNEFLELRCRQAFLGSCKAWPGWVTSIKRKSLLIQELYKEMQGFKSMEEEVMVDELVNKDMSIGCGRWLNFDTEAFEEGLEVGQDILGYLINDLISDLLLV